MAKSLIGLFLLHVFTSSAWSTLPPEPEWCKSMPSSHCYNARIREIDCHTTCPSIRNPNDPNCEYGDHFEWCATIDIDRCEEEVIWKDCNCVRCIKYTHVSTITTGEPVTAVPKASLTRNGFHWIFLVVSVTVILLVISIYCVVRKNGLSPEDIRKKRD